MAAQSSKPDDGKHYDRTPGPRTNTALANWQEFETSLQERQSDIAAMLPSHVSKARFLATAVSAVKQNPDLLKASARSLMGAVTKAAQDGLLPDGREGVITAYNGEAKWNPMTHGLRKRARELESMIIDCQVVHEHDHFVWHQGDDPKIEHTPTQLGAKRGSMIGAYAIFKSKDRAVLHREVMNADQIETVHGQSNAKNSLMWTKFVEEAWRKTVLRRGIKSVPVGEQLENIVHRDDDDFVFEGTPPVISDAGVMTPPRPKQSEFEQSKPQDAAAAEKAKPAEKSAKAAEPQKSSPDGRPEPPPPDGVVDEIPQGQERGPRRDQDVPSSYRKDPENAVDVEEERDEDEDGPSANFAEAQKMLARMTDSIKADPDMDLDQLSTMGKTNIAEFADLTDDERAMLRGTWVSTILEAKRAKSKPKKSK